MSLVRSLLDEDYWPLSRRRAAGDSWDDWPLMTPLSFNFPMRNFYRGTPTALSRYLADEFRQMQELERQMLDISTDQEGGQITFSCNVAGYLPGELNVNVEGDSLIIQGEHKEQTGGQTIHRTFRRAVTLPEGIIKESIQCNVDEQGYLSVQANRPEGPQPQRMSIPIGYKPAEKGKQGLAIEGAQKKGA